MRVAILWGWIVWGYVWLPTFAAGEIATGDSPQEYRALILKESIPEASAEPHHITRFKSSRNQKGAEPTSLPDEQFPEAEPIADPITPEPSLPRCEAAQTCCVHTQRFICPDQDVDIEFVPSDDPDYRLSDENIAFVAEQLQALPPSHLKGLKRIRTAPFVGLWEPATVLEDDSLVLKVAPRSIRETFPVQPGANLTMAVGRWVYQKHFSEDEREHFRRHGVFASDYDFAAFYNIWTADTPQVLDRALRDWNHPNSNRNLPKFLAIASLFRQGTDRMHFYGISLLPGGLATTSASLMPFSVDETLLRIGSYAFRRENDALVSSVDSQGIPFDFRVPPPTLPSFVWERFSAATPR